MLYRPVEASRNKGGCYDMGKNCTRSVLVRSYQGLRGILSSVLLIKDLDRGCIRSKWGI